MMQEFGCHTKGRYAFGVAQHYPYSAYLEKNAEPAEIHFSFVVDGSTRAVAMRLKREKVPHIRFFAHADEEDGLHVLAAVVTPPTDFYAKGDIHGLLLIVSEVFKAVGLNAPANCPLCHLGGCDAYAYLSDEYRPTHTACLQTRLNLPEEDAAPVRKAKGNVFTGILGALFGAFVAALPVWTLAMNRGNVYFALYAFIPILSGLCYRLFRGKASTVPAGLSVLIASLLMAFALELAWYWMVLSSQVSVAISFWESTADYFATHNLGLTLREMLSCLLALVVGYVAVSIFLRRFVDEVGKKTTLVHGAKFVRESAVTAAHFAEEGKKRIPEDVTGPNAGPDDKPKTGG